jgi:hypothetical protein
LNNLCDIDLDFVKVQLGDTFQSELFHVLSHILTFCCTEVINIVDRTEVGTKGRLTRDLLDETILLIGHFTLQNGKHQEMVQYFNGRSPTLLQRLCSLPIQYFTDPKCKEVLMPTIISICYANDTNKDILEREMSTQMVVNFIRNYEQGTESRFSFGRRFPADLRDKAAQFFEQ